MKQLTLFVMLLFSMSGQTTTLLHAGKLIDVAAGQVVAEQTVVIDKGRIVEVLDGYVNRDEAVVIDLRSATVMPGLMDMHVHLDGELNPPESYAEAYYMNSAEYALRATIYARRTLEAGFTTVRDLGTGDHEALFALRDAIAQGIVAGPRIFAAGKSIATTGGHADPTNGIREDLRGDPGPKEGVINGPEDAYKAIRQRYKDGSDVVKLTVTGGVLSLAKSGDNPQFTRDELDAVMSAAKDYNFVVAVHAHGPEGMKRAVLAGVHSVEHGTYMTPEIMSLMRDRGTWYVPTISAGKWVAELAEQDGKLPDVVRPKAAAVGPQIQNTFASAWSAGVPIAFGTDSGVSPHGLNGREFQYMVEAGMPAMEAIRSATINAAKLLRASDDLGEIKPGAYADIVAVYGDPLADITELESVGFVMKEGEVVFSREE
ncbi:MAG: amidohydrolase family protein [Luminiphilus sp.]|nr:amidohydrolase family protein [Luminiphilus sp.]